MSSILCGDTMVPNIESSFWGIVLYIRNIILLGLTTQKNATHLGCDLLFEGFIGDTLGICRGVLRSCSHNRV